MQDFKLPFPDRTLADQELTYDPCYARIPEADRPLLVEQAWRRGADAARMIYERFGGETDFFKITAASGLTCKQIDKDYIAGNQRYFSDYISGQSLINLYLGSIHLWAEQNGLTLEAAQNLILSHEFFHFLECTELGLTSRIYQVPMIKIGPLKIGRTGLRALSEIGAHAFAHTYYELTAERGQ